MSAPTPRDKERLTFIECPDGTYSQQVTIKDAGTTDPTDVPIMQCLEDANGVTFFGTYLIDPTDGSVSGGPIYTDADGNPFTPATPITKPVKVFDSELKLFCDEGNANEKYFKVIVFDENGEVISVTNTDLLGAAYTPVGPEILCENEQDDIRVFTEILCDAGASNKPYLACYTKNITTNTNTLLTYELDGSTAYTPVTPDVFKADEEDTLTTLVLCDVGNNNTPYLACYNKDALGNVTTQAYDLAGAAYTPTTAGVYKPKDYEVKKIWILDTDSAANEATEQYWEANAITTGIGGDNADLSESFTLTDECGFPKHENDADATNVISTDGAQTTDNTGVNVPHQNQVDLYLCVPRGGAKLRYNVTGDVNTRLYLGKCNAKMSLSYASPNPVSATAPDYEETLSEGIYQVRYYIDDPSQNGNARLQWSFDGTSYSDIPISNIFSSQPIVKSEFVRVCAEDGVIERLDGTALLANEKAYYCDPCDGTTSAAASEEINTFNTEKICVTQENILTANVQVSAGANALLQWTTDNISTGSDGIYRYQIDTGAGRVYMDRSDSIDLSDCPDGEYAFNYSIVMNSGYVYTSFRATTYTITNGVISGVTNGGFQVSATYRYKVRDVVAVYNCDGSVKGYYRADGTEDTLAAGEEYSVDCPNNPTYIPDVGTPKTPVPDTCVLREIYVADGGTVGFSREYWEASATQPVATATVAQAFTEIDECGKLQHPNAPDTTAPVEAYPADGARTFDNNAAGVQHQARTSGFICIPSGGKILSISKTGSHASALYLGPCNGKERPVIEAPIADSGIVGAIPLFEGIYKFTLYAHDNGTTGFSRLRWSNLDGSNSQNVPATEIFEEKPSVSKVFAWITKGETDATGLDGVQYDLVNDKVFLCDPLNGDVGEGINLLNVLDNANKDTATLVGNERITITAGGVDSSNLTIPASANGAVLQVQIKDSNERGNCITWYADGRTPTATAGLQAGHKEYIYLGCAASNQANVSDDPMELANFEINVGEVANGDVCVEVIYYAF